MPLPSPVSEFYDELWNRRDRARIGEILHADATFRGSLGSERQGHEGIWRYVEEVTGSLADYHCEEITSVTSILSGVRNDARVFARMRFSGRHVAPFRGFAPTGERVSWEGAALFEVEDGLVRDVWVLGDLAGLDALLARQRDGSG